MVVPLATDMPFNFDNPIAWKLLNQRSTASRSSSLQRSRISLCRTWRTSGSITKLCANRFWRFPFWRVVGLITDGCSKCCCGLGFEHFYSVWNPGSICRKRLKVFLWAVLLWGCSNGSDRLAASFRQAWCRSADNRRDILQRPAQPKSPSLSLAHPSVLNTMLMLCDEAIQKETPA